MPLYFFNLNDGDKVIPIGRDGTLGRPIRSHSCFRVMRELARTRDADEGVASRRLRGRYTMFRIVVRAGRRHKIRYPRDVRSRPD